MRILLAFWATLALAATTTASVLVGGAGAGGGGAGRGSDGAPNVGPGARRVLLRLGINPLAVEDGRGVGRGGRGERSGGRYPWPPNSPFFTVVRARQEEPYSGHEGRVAPAQSPVYYIQLPPTSHYYVTNSILERDPGAAEEPFEQVPLDFTNNGRPYQMYRWTSTASIPPSPSSKPAAPWNPRPATPSVDHAVAQSEIHQFGVMSSKDPVQPSSSFTFSSHSSPSSSSTTSSPSTASLDQPSPPFLLPAEGTTTPVVPDTLPPTTPSPSSSPGEFPQKFSSLRVAPESPSKRPFPSLVFPTKPSKGSSPPRPPASPPRSPSFPKPLTRPSPSLTSSASTPGETTPYEEEDLGSPPERPSILTDALVSQAMGPPSGETPTSPLRPSLLTIAPAASPKRPSSFSEASKGPSPLLLTATSGTSLPKKASLYIRNKSRYNGRPAHVYVWKRGQPHVVQNDVKNYLKRYR